MVMTDAVEDGSPTLLRLMQLVSPILPVGAYAYSQGMEYAVHAAWLNDEESVASWILGLLDHVLARVDVPILARFYRGWTLTDENSLQYWSGYLSACRESRELQHEDRQLGQALARLLCDLGIQEAAPWINHSDAAFAVLFSLAAERWRLPLKETVHGYLWSWAENQVMAAIKLIPLGQTAGQRILSKACEAIPRATSRGLRLRDEQIGFVAQRLAIGSALHEHQYSRLFRS